MVLSQPDAKSVLVAFGTLVSCHFLTLNSAQNIERIVQNVDVTSYEISANQCIHMHPRLDIVNLDIVKSLI